MQGFVGILSHTKRQVTRELLRGIGLEGFFDFIDFKLSEVSLCSRRIFGRGGCLSPLTPSICRAVSVCTSGVGERGICLFLRLSLQVTVAYSVE